MSIMSAAITDMFNSVNVAMHSGIMRSNFSLHVMLENTADSRLQLIKV